MLGLIHFIYFLLFGCARIVLPLTTLCLAIQEVILLCVRRGQGSTLGIALPHSWLSLVSQRGLVPAETCSTTEVLQMMSYVDLMLIRAELLIVRRDVWCSGSHLDDASCLAGGTYHDS